MTQADGRGRPCNRRGPAWSQRASRGTCKRCDSRRQAAVFTATQVDVSYSGKLALQGVDMTIYKNQVTAFIGPSGCGKSTYIRCFNRMNDLIPGAEVTGRDPLPRTGSLRQRSRPGAGSSTDRHGLPEAEPVRQVDLRERRLRPARPRDEEGPGRARRTVAPAGGALGRSEGSPQGEWRSDSPAGSSRDSASRARWPSNRTCS